LHDASLPADVPVARLLDPALARLVGDYVLLHALALHRGLYRLLARQAERRWVYEPPRLTSQARVAVLGLGEIGSRCLAQLEAAGFRVTGWCLRPKPHLAGKAVSGPEALPDLLAGADIVAALLPSTPTTRNLFARPLFAAMKRGAGLINAGRGDLVVDEDLLWALDEGILAHAVLDVARTEPLPEAHPFWRHPGVTLTPHCAGATSPDVALDTVAGNIRAALRGAPVGGLIDRQRGY
ncbi:MAG: glyoxylate/hydroxypyruvate reductase A, partial [Rhodobacteraceae bacterium]|nr:glyoxylate/hydroxypyruvate reductase A [Paracoccaceae bacterium]